MPPPRRYKSDAERNAAKYERRRASRAAIPETERSKLRQAHAAAQRERRARMSEAQRKVFRERQTAYERERCSRMRENKCNTLKEVEGTLRTTNTVHEQTNQGVRTIKSNARYLQCANCLVRFSDLQKQKVSQCNVEGMSGSSVVMPLAQIVNYVFRLPSSQQLLDNELGFCVTCVSLLYHLYAYHQKLENLTQTGSLLENIVKQPDQVLPSCLTNTLTLGVTPECNGTEVPQVNSILPLIIKQEPDEDYSKVDVIVPGDSAGFQLETVTVDGGEIDDEMEYSSFPSFDVDESAQVQDQDPLAVHSHINQGDIHGDDFYAQSEFGNLTKPTELCRT